MFLGLPPGLFPESLEIRPLAAPEDRYGLFYRAAVPEEDRDEVLAHVRRGLNSLVLFEIRIFRETNAWFGRYSLAGQFEVEQDGSWDPFREVFVITREGFRREYASGEEFFPALFCLWDFPLDFVDFSPGTYQVRVRAKFQEVKLSPPLNILSFFTSLRWLGMPWTIRDFTVGPPPAEGAAD